MEPITNPENKKDTFNPLETLLVGNEEMKRVYDYGIKHGVIQERTRIFNTLFQMLKI